LAGPKRGIEFYDCIVIEYDLRIKTSEQEKHDQQLIDGASMICNRGLQNCSAFTHHIHGDSGAIDMVVSCVEQAIEATVEVVISEVQSNFNLALVCFTSGMSEKIRLFDGAIAGTRVLKRRVVAVEIYSCIDLKFKVGTEPSSSDEHRCSFYTGNHGFNTQKVKTDFALFSVKVSWSGMPNC
jgi:hypothetical protein